MASNVTLLQMRTSIQFEGGWENSADITPALLNDFINRAVKRVWNVLRLKRGDLLIKRGTVATTINVDTVSLPSDFYQLRKIEIADTSAPTGFRRLRAVDLDVSHQFATLYAKRYRYRLEGVSIVLHPTPQAVESLRLFYIPTAPTLAADGDTFDGVNGFEDLVFDIVIYRCRNRQEQDVSVIERDIARMLAEVSAASDGRDAEPMYLSPYGAAGNVTDDPDDVFWAGW